LRHILILHQQGPRAHTLMLSLFNLHGRQPTCARPKTCAPPRPGLHPPLNTLQKDMWVGLTPLRVLDLFLKHSKCGADGDLASQEELEALQVRTGNTPPGAPGQAPSLPPGLPTLLLRCASAPLICAGEGPDGGDLTAVPGGVAAAAPAPVQAHALAGISVGTLPCRRRRQAGAAAAGNPVGSLARSGAAAAACGALARTVSCPAGQAVDGGRRAGPGCRPQRERGALRQHAWERAPRPGAARPLRTSPSRRAHPARPAACLAEQLPPCTGQSWQASGLRAHPVAKKKLKHPAAPRVQVAGGVLYQGVLCEIQTTRTRQCSSSAQDRLPPACAVSSDTCPGPCAQRPGGPTTGRVAV